MPAQDDPTLGPSIPPRSNRGMVNLVLLLISFYTMTLCGALAQESASGFEGAGAALLLDPRFLSLGLSYSLCLLAILGAHEMGHYLACRHYNVSASLPYFIPSLPFPTGTFGAFIRIREPIPDRKVLFDVGVAGPLAGFCVALPVLIVGMLSAQPVPVPENSLTLGDPLLMTLLSAWLAPVAPPGYTILLSGPLFAGWVGCLATAINLFPIGQLDGGHVCYAVSAAFHRHASRIGLAGFLVMALLLYPGWLLMVALLVIVTPRHPPLLDERPGLSRGRILVAWVALAILVLCFIPVPLDISGL